MTLYSGTSDWRRAPKYSGFSGYSGYSGVSGVSGYSGAGSMGYSASNVDVMGDIPYSNTSQWFSPAGMNNSYNNATKYLASDVGPKTTINRKNMSNKYNAMEICRGK